MSISDIPCFNGKNFQGWSEKMIGVFMIAKVNGVVQGETVKPADNEHPSLPNPPTLITDQTDAAGVTHLNALWNQYNMRLTYYHQQINVYDRKVSSYNDANSQAMGIINRALDIGIWDQVKAKTAKETWDWLKSKYAKSSHLEVMEHFRFIKDQKIDLSDPNPQLATFMHHYQAVPATFVSSTMASLILLSNLLLTTNPGQESVYICLLENKFKEETIASMTLEVIMEQISDV